MESSAVFREFSTLFLTSLFYNFAGISQQEYTEAVNASTGIQWLCEPCQVPVAEGSRISSESSVAILDSSEFNPTRGDSFKVSLLISFLSFRFPVHNLSEISRRGKRTFEALLCESSKRKGQTILLM